MAVQRYNAPWSIALRVIHSAWLRSPGSGHRQQFRQSSGGRDRPGPPPPAAGNAQPNERNDREKADGGSEPASVELDHVIEPVRLRRALDRLHVDRGAG